MSRYQLPSGATVSLDEIEVADIAIADGEPVLDNEGKLRRWAQQRVRYGPLPQSMQEVKDQNAAVGMVMVCVSAGKQLGFTVEQSLVYIAVINNRPCLWGDGLLGHCRRSAEFEWMEERFEMDGEVIPDEEAARLAGTREPPQDLVAICRVKRKTETEPLIRVFSVGQAFKAGLWGKRAWATYPDRMLRMRARAFALRDQFADLIVGFGSAEELLDLEVAERSEVRPPIKRPRAAVAGEGEGTAAPAGGTEAPARGAAPNLPHEPVTPAAGAPVHAPGRSGPAPAGADLAHSQSAPAPPTSPVQGGPAPAMAADRPAQSSPAANDARITLPQHAELWRKLRQHYTGNSADQSRDDEIKRDYFGGNWGRGTTQAQCAAMLAKLLPPAEEVGEVDLTEPGSDG